MTDILIIIWLHFLGDFIFQTDRMALNKSKSNLILAEHCVIYSILFMYFGWAFMVVNGVLHFMTDWCTSRATSHLWKNNQRHWFFTVIGLDQAIHFTCMIVSYNYLVKPW